MPGHSGPLDEGGRIDATIIDFSEAFVSVIHDRLFTKLAASGVVSTVVVWVRELLVGRTERVRLGGQLSKEVKIISGAPEGSVLGPLLFLVYVNDIWRNIDSSTRLFADGCIIYRKITSTNDIEKLHKDLDTLGGMSGRKWDENESRCKTIRFTRDRVKNPLGCTLGEQKITEASSFK